MAFTTVGRHIAPRMAPCCRFFHSSTAFMTVACRIALQTALCCSFFHWSMAFLTFRLLHFSVDGSVLLLLPLVYGFHSLRAVLLSGGQRIAHSSLRPWLTRLFTRSIAHSSCHLRLSRPFACAFTQPMSAHCLFFRSPMGFTVCALYCLADGGGFLILPFINGFHHCLHAVLLRSWQQIAHTSACHQISRQLRAILLCKWHRVACSCTCRRLLRFTRRIAQRMVADCAFFHLSTAFPTLFSAYCSADGSVLLILSLMNSFHD